MMQEQIGNDDLSFGGGPRKNIGDEDLRMPANFFKGGQRLRRNIVFKIEQGHVLGRERRGDFLSGAQHEITVTRSEFGYAIKGILAGEAEELRRQDGVMAHERVETAQIATGMEGLRVSRRQLVQIFGLNDPFHAGETSNRAP